MPKYLNGGLTNMITTESTPVIKNGCINTPQGSIVYDVVNPDINNVPIFLINGGPCGCRDMLLRTIGNITTDRPVVSYSQMNSIGSQPISREDNSYWTLEYYTEEIERVRAELGYEKILLFGHSWGGALAFNYANLHSDHCIGIAAASALIETQTWIKDTQRRLEEIKPEVDAFMQEVEEAGLTPADAEKLRNTAELSLFSSRYQSSLYSPETYLKVFLKHKDSETKFPGREVYHYMWGHSEYEVTGTLKDLDLSYILPKLDIPVLFICGNSDEVQTDTIGTYSNKVKDSSLHIVNSGTHCFMEDADLENKELFKSVLKEWISDTTLKYTLNYIQTH